MSPHLFDCLKLIRTKNIGVTRFFELIEQFKTPTKALQELPKLAEQKRLSFSFEIPSDTSIQAEIDRTTAFGAHFICYFDDHYPENLKHISDPPPVLITKGNLDLLTKPKIAIVGSRNASMNGQRFSAKLAKELGENSYVTISGLARGIDGAIHQASLETGTIGVIAGGIDHIYPQENTPLFNELYKKGLILTEMPIGTTARAQDFPRRNRIVAGLSLGVVVIEAALKSGSLITARLANDYGRDVFAVPGSPLDPRSQGTNKLIQNGAKLIQSCEDILDDIPTYTQPSKNTAPQNSFDFDTEQTTKPETTKIETDNLGQLILNSLDTTPIETDLVIRNISSNMNNISTQDCLQKILELEFQGSIIRHTGNKLSKN